MHSRPRKQENQEQAIEYFCKLKHRTRITKDQINERGDGSFCKIHRTRGQTENMKRGLKMQNVESLAN